METGTAGERGQHDGRADAASEPDWHAMTVDEALEELDADRGGLSQEQAEQRLDEVGPNRIREQETVSPWRILLNQFTSPLIYVLLAALVVTLSIQSWSDAIVIGAVLVINGTIGFVQEFRAESAVQSLMAMVSPQATVVRDGAQRSIDAEELVPGDLVELRQGAVVPADIRLIEVASLQIDESPLTGESVPVDKATEPVEDANLPPADQTDVAFMGTAVTSGNGHGVVVATGARTAIGQIAEQVEEARGGETPLQLRIDRLARWIAVAILGVAVVAFGMGVLLGRGVFEMLLLGVALAVAAIPAGLPIVVTVALAIGVRRMTERQAMIRNLHAVDTLGSCNIILSDKTGTLTQNRMTVRATVTGIRPPEQSDTDGTDADSPAGSDPAASDDARLDLDQDPHLRELLVAGVLCNDIEVDVVSDGDGEQPSGDPMEIALVAAAADAGLDPREIRDTHPRRDTVPFRTEQRYMATIHDDPDDDGLLVVVKGAPERVAEMCDHQRTGEAGRRALDPADVIDRSETLADQGLRVLAAAVGHGQAAADTVRSDDPNGLTFVGMYGLLDPPRDTAIEAIERCHEAGIRVMVVTGDHATTARAIGRQIGIGVRPGAGTEAHDGTSDHSPDGARPRVIEGRELAEMSDQVFDERLAETDIYARVAPEQKLRIVERLKAQDQVVAVTGDGVNDAPALESAHIGAAMGSGTDVAKEASDMVIADDDFASVYAAVEEGRTAFRNVRVATFFLLSTGLADVLIILSTLGLRWPLPFLPAQILWVNVVTNGIADVALAFEPGERSLFRRPPRPKSEGVLDRALIERLVIVGLWLTVGTVGVFWWSWGIRGDDVDLARTIAVTTLVLFQKVHVFNCRSEDRSVFRMSLLTNKLLFVGVLTSLAAHVGALYWSVTQELLGFEPLGLDAWLIAAAIAATAIIPNELHKRLRPRPTVAVPAAQ